MIVIDASNHVLGRLSTEVAQKIMGGEEVVIVNAEKALITGRKEFILSRYKQRKDRGKIRKGPYYPRRADLILKRAIRSMIPYDKSTGREAYKRLKVYVGVPPEYEKTEKQKVERAMKVTTSKYVTLSEISAYLGSRIR